MAIEPRNVEDRLSRLEALTAILVAYENNFVDPESEELVYRLLRRSFRDGLEEDDFLWRRLFEQRRKFGASARDRLRSIEGAVEQMRGAQAEAARVVNQQASIKQRLDVAIDKTARLGKQQAELGQSVTANQHEAHSFLALLSMGLNLAEVKTPRLLPVRVYLRDDNSLETANVAKQVERLLSAFGFAVADDFPAESGSWWKKWFAKTTDVMTQPEVYERLQKIERALEMSALLKPQAEIDRNQAEAVQALLDGIKDQVHATVQVGSILVLKTTNANEKSIVHVRQLSQKQLIAIENAPELLQSPGKALELLGEACRVPELPGLSTGGTADP